MTTLKMKIEYGGYEISYSDYSGFVVELDGAAVAKAKSLELARAWIDTKSKQKFKRVPVLAQFGFNRHFSPGHATSMIDQRHVWLVSGKERKKEMIDNVWVDCPENRAARALISEKKAVVAELSDEISKIEDNTIRLTSEMMALEGEGENNGQ